MLGELLTLFFCLSMLIYFSQFFTLQLNSKEGGLRKLQIIRNKASCFRKAHFHKWLISLNLRSKIKKKKKLNNHNSMPFKVSF